MTLCLQLVITLKTHITHGSLGRSVFLNYDCGTCGDAMALTPDDSLLRENLLKPLFFHGFFNLGSSCLGSSWIFSSWDLQSHITAAEDWSWIIITTKNSAKHGAREP